MFKSAMEQGEKLAGVQVLRGFAALGVVIFHAGGSISSRQYQGNETIGLATRGLDAGVDLFFVISGFVIALPLVNNKTASASRFVFSRLSRVYPMAILTAAIFIGLSAVLFGNSPDSIAIVFLTSAFLIPAPVETVPIVLWTLKQEVLFYLVFSVALFDRRIGLALLATWGVASFVVSEKHFILAWLFHLKNIGFLAGILACYAFVHFRPGTRVAWLITMAGGTAFLAIAISAPYLHPTPRLLSLLLAAFSAVLVYGAAGLELRRGVALIFLGTASYSLYLIHFIFVSAGNKVIITITPWLPDGLALIALVSFATIGSIAFYLLTERHIELWRKDIQARIFSRKTK